MNEKQKEKKNRMKYDSKYIAHCKNGNSAAIFIMRDIQTEYNVDDYWIDVIQRVLNCPKEEGKPHDFKWFCVELFPKKRRPNYTEGMKKTEKHYLTWLTANEDIEEQRENGYVGSQYVVSPYIEYKTEKIEVPKEFSLEIYDKEKDEWLDCGNGPVPPNAIYRKKITQLEEREITTSDFEYKILSIRKIF